MATTGSNTRRKYICIVCVCARARARAGGGGGWGEIEIAPARPRARDRERKREKERHERARNPGRRKQPERQKLLRGLGDNGIVRFYADDKVLPPRANNVDHFKSFPMLLCPGCPRVRGGGLGGRGGRMGRGRRGCGEMRVRWTKLNACNIFLNAHKFLKKFPQARMSVSCAHTRKAVTIEPLPHEDIFHGAVSI